MKVCQHQVQQSHTYAKFMNVVWTIILPPCKLWSFLSVKVCLHSLANQTQRCSVVRSYLFELARQREGWKLRVHVNLHLRVSLYKPRGLVLKNSDLSHHCREIKRCVSVAYRSYFTNKSFRAVRSLRDLWYLCAIMCVCVRLWKQHSLWI